MATSWDGHIFSMVVLMVGMAQAYVVFKMYDLYANDT